MSVHAPRRRQFTPLSPEETASRHAEIEAWRAEQESRMAALRPARLAALHTGPSLRDVDAAADCMCGCHPRPADVELHEGGATCSCQQTPQERKQAMDEVFERLRDLAPDPAIEQAAQARFHEHAQELGIAARVAVSAAPFVITGNVDGRGFYLRERHDIYRVTVAPDDDPAADPWDLPAERATLDIASGDAEELSDPQGGWDPVHALTLAVGAVRLFLRRRACRHEQPGGSPHVFCCHCGVRLSEASLWAPDQREIGA